MKFLIFFLGLLVAGAVSAHEVVTEHREVGVYTFCSAIPPADCGNTVGDSLVQTESSVTHDGGLYTYTWDISCLSEVCQDMVVVTSETGTCASLSAITSEIRSLPDSPLGAFAKDADNVNCVTTGGAIGNIAASFDLFAPDESLNRITFNSTCAPAYVNYRVKGSPENPLGIFASGGGKILAPWCGAPVTDTDGDGRDDSLDNCLDNCTPAGSGTCITAKNGETGPDAGGHVQRDADGDGYGNVCDADFNNDGIVDDADNALFQAEFLGTNPIYDLDGDGFVNYGDLPYFGTLYGSPPGPSGIAP